MPLKRTKKASGSRSAPVSRCTSWQDKTSRAYVAYLDLLEAAEYLRGEMSGQLAMLT